MISEIYGFRLVEGGNAADLDTLIGKHPKGFLNVGDAIPKVRAEREIDALHVNGQLSLVLRRWSFVLGPSSVVIRQDSLSEPSLRNRGRYDERIRLSPL